MASDIHLKMFYFLLIFCIIAQSLSLPTKKNETENDIESRIVGGLMATRGQFPFLVALRIRTSTASYFCGGSLLNTHWVVTAGHSVYEAVSFTIYLGSTTLNEEDPHIVIAAAEHYELHPDYNPNTLQNDIALVAFRMPIMYSDYIKPINMLPGAPLSDGSPVITMGWGQISDSNPELQDRVLYITVTTIGNDECKLYYGNQIVDSMACAATNFNGGTCYGDTGGPLIQYVSRLQVMLVGVSSFISQNGCESPEPSGFTRVQVYSDWIRNITGFS